MKTTQPSLAEGLPPDKPTFAALVRGTHPPQEFIKAASSHKGEPALQFTDQEVCDLSSPLRFALIGKFTSSRPSMDFLRRGFKTIGFQGDFTLGLMDPHHVLIRFALEDDYHRCWLHSTWKFRTHVMKVLKWTPDFSVKEEPPVVPIWISLEQLPLFLFARGPLFSIGRLIGRPLKIDAATLSLSRPSVARLCVEIDLRHQLPGRVWIGLPKGGFWQHINYDPLPEYCFDCCSLGHLQADCGKSQQLKPQEKKIWRPIGSQIQPDCVPAADDPVVDQAAQPQHSAVEKENMIQTNLNNQIVPDTPSTSSASPIVKDHVNDSVTSTAVLAPSGHEESTEPCHAPLRNAVSCDNVSDRPLADDAFVLPTVDVVQNAGPINNLTYAEIVGANHLALVPCVAMEKPAGTNAATVVEPMVGPSTAADDATLRIQTAHQKPNFYIELNPKMSWKSDVYKVGIHDVHTTHTPVYHEVDYEEDDNDDWIEEEEENFWDKQFVRDESYLQRKRGRPPGALRKPFYEPHPMKTRSKSID